MTMKELIEEVISLPVENRAIVADSILRDFHRPEWEVGRNDQFPPSDGDRRGNTADVSSLSRPLQFLRGEDSQWIIKVTPLDGQVP